MTLLRYRGANAIKRIAGIAFTDGVLFRQDFSEPVRIWIKNHARNWVRGPWETDTKVPEAERYTNIPSFAAGHEDHGQTTVTAKESHLQHEPAARPDSPQLLSASSLRCTRRLVDPATLRLEASASSSRPSGAHEQPAALLDVWRSGRASAATAAAALASVATASADPPEPAAGLAIQPEPAAASRPATTAATAAAAAATAF
ncbi:hypothetical protein HK096_006614 [Nowakowskiella sp. JEL0078]|nr:hypothetical protein HK096_006614 [Nowakowskiella sp. JEL0078]